MTTQNLTTTETKATEKKGSLTGGLIMIAIGVSLMVAQLTGFGWLFPLALGLGFLTAGALTRKPGLIIPGGILSGVGLGVIAVDNAWFAPANSEASGGVFLLAFAAGWVLISVFTRLFSDETHVWALIPGGIMALIGSLILAGQPGLVILEKIGEYWPVVLILIGLVILYQWWKER